ncbi:substrate-binding domain-containing protein [Clostridium formicaceticum]|uniref:PBP superfamily domain protein n=1 Tax=Clostridium formicaceticum TaxID=1497 RepID=A0AAC9RMA2_9CLOT|nr:substrate-binding domain-containing protein [Clostridium formicaceticum]ARE86900.1 PBP superfamily domain protein [Clostridium formicaceticum]
MKKVLFVFLCCFMLMTLNVQAQQPVEVVVDNHPVVFTGQEAIYDDTQNVVFIPLHAVCESLGAEVKWDDVAEKAIVKLMNKTVEVPIKDTQITVNSKKVDLENNIVVMNQRMMVPMEFINKVLGSKVDWNKSEGLVSIFDRNSKIKMASTIGPIDAGIVGTLAQKFEEKTDVNVEYLGAGTGKALEMSKTGDFDLVMVHAKALEEQFIADGYGEERIAVMYNDFVIIGPANDPAEIKGRTVADALKKIMENEIKFVSRGDNSGTHVKEMELWEEAGLSPEGDWYIVWEGGSQGNSATLKYTNEQQAYTMIDRATYLALKNEITIIPLVEGEEALLNFISVIPVNPERFSQVNHSLAMAFIEFMTSEEGQTIIRDFKKDIYGEPMFFPDSTEWKNLSR